MKLKAFMKVMGMYCKDHAPEILTGVGVAGMIGTVVLFVRATPAAVDELREKNPDTVWEEIKILGKHYIWGIVAGTLTIVCIVGSCSVSKRKNAALAAALTLTEQDLIDHKEKVKELFGEKKEEKVEEAIAEDKVQKMELSDHMIRTGTGQTLCLDLITGQTFWSDVNWIKSRFIDLNDYLQDNEEMDISDYADIMHLDDPQLIGHSLGWRYDPHNRIELSATSTLKDGIPVFVIGHRNPPRWDYAK